MKWAEYANALPAKRVSIPANVRLFKSFKMRRTPWVGDVHVLVGKRDGTGNRVHIVIDGKTAEIRVEDNQTVPEELIKSIESTLTLHDGRTVRFTRELIELENRSWEDEVEGFSAHIVQIGGSGSRVVTKTAWLLTEHGYLNADNFVSVGFTSGGDMIVGAKSGFAIVAHP